MLILSSLFQNVSTCLAALKGKAGMTVQGSPTLGPSSIQLLMASQFTAHSPPLDPVVPSTSIAHLAQAVHSLGGLQAQYSSVDAW